MDGIARRWDWNLIPSFLAVLEAGSLSAAARASGISQPTLSRHLADLEAALGVTLFERGREGARPTPDALAIAAAARSMADMAGRIDLSAAGSSEAVAGVVRITASEIVATYMLPAIIGEILRDLPGIEIELVASNEVENLLRRDADIAVRMAEPQQLDLISRRICSLEMGAYGHRDYLQRAGTPTALQEIAGHVVIGYDRSDLVLRGFRAIGHEVGRDFFRLRTDDQVAAFEALKAGVGLGFAPVWLASRFPELQRFGEQFAIPSLSLHLVTHRELRTSARIRAVYDRLADGIAEICQPFAPG
jgi:DNA-binding transcriptional LysR family regulator